jgi:hypothetical protein
LPTAPPPVPSPARVGWLAGAAAALGLAAAALGGVALLVAVGLAAATSLSRDDTTSSAAEGPSEPTPAAPASIPSPEPASAPEPVASQRLTHPPTTPEPRAPSASVAAPEAAEAPSAKATARTGRFEVGGKVTRVELHADSGASWSPGSTPPAGRYRVWADFGGGLQPAERRVGPSEPPTVDRAAYATVVAGATTIVQCSATRFHCEQLPGGTP